MSSLERLPIEILDEAFKYSDVNTLAMLERTSSELCERIRAYKARCSDIILSRYTVENSLFASRMNSGWLMTTEVHRFNGLQRTFSPMDGPTVLQPHLHVRRQSSTSIPLFQAAVLRQWFSRQFGLDVSSRPGLECSWLAQNVLTALRSSLVTWIYHARDSAGWRQSFDPCHGLARFTCCGFPAAQ